MNIKDIVSEWLTKNGYSGLCNEDEECGCTIEDLFPCGEPWPDCEPGYKVNCNCPEHVGWHSWHIEKEKDPVPDSPTKQLLHNEHIPLDKVLLTVDGNNVSISVNKHDISG